MNHFDAVDFSECHSEEVISFFWRSVYDMRGNDDNYAVFCYLSNNQLHVNTFLVKVIPKAKSLVFPHRTYSINLIMIHMTI